MRDMFSRCSNLEELDISNFNFNNVIISEKDFEFCGSLKKVHIPTSADTYIVKLFDKILSKSKNKK